MAANVVALRPDTDTKFDQWLDQGQELAENHKRSLWEIGDWWARGEYAYGDRTMLALELFGGTLSLSRIRQLGWVAKSIDPSFRKDALGFGVHTAIAPLAPEDQRVMLADAERGKWGAARTREEINLRFEPTTWHGGPVDTAKPRQRREIPLSDAPDNPSDDDTPVWTGCPIVPASKIRGRIRSQVSSIKEHDWEPDDLESFANEYEIGARAIRRKIKKEASTNV